MSRLDTLQARFPDIPRSVLIKTDVLREGIRFSPVLNQVGRWCIPHFLQWNPEHSFDVAANGDAPEDWLLTPWNFRLSDGTTIKTRFWDPTAPYELVRTQDGVWLYRDGEPVEPVHFHRRPDWYLDRTSDGTVNATVVQLWAPECWYTVSLRYCQYTSTGDQCRFCCLMPSLGKKGGELGGLGYKVAMTPATIAEAFRIGAQAGRVKHFAITGGAILNNSREIERMAKVFQALSDVRSELGVDVSFNANPSGLEAHELARLRDAGVDSVTMNLEVWDERLWPIIVPGKQKFFGRERYLESIQRAAGVFGDWNVNSYFVTGTETVPEEVFRSPEAAIDSVVEGVRWCVENKVSPNTTMWLPAPGSMWADKPEPPTEYYLQLGQAIHQTLDETGYYAASPPEHSGQCQECQDCCIHVDHYYQDRLETQVPDVFTAAPTRLAESEPIVVSSGRITSADQWLHQVLPHKLQDDPSRSGGFEGAFVFAIAGDQGGTWTATIAGDDVAVSEGAATDATFSVAMKDEHFVRMMNGELSGHMAFLTGKLKFRGNVAAAMKLQGLLF